VTHSIGRTVLAVGMCYQTTSRPVELTAEESGRRDPLAKTRKGEVSGNPIVRFRRALEGKEPSLNDQMSGWDCDNRKKGHGFLGKGVQNPRERGAVPRM